MNITQKTGKCFCYYEPKGEHGLEGYDLNKYYIYKLLKNKDKKPQKWFRIYHTKNGYCETCGFYIFKKYFKIVNL